MDKMTTGIDEVLISTLSDAVSAVLSAVMTVRSKHDT